MAAGGQVTAHPTDTGDLRILGVEARASQARGFRAPGTGSKVGPLQFRYDLVRRSITVEAGRWRPSQVESMVVCAVLGRTTSLRSKPCDSTPVTIADSFDRS